MNYTESTLAKDPSENFNDACLEVYRKQRPGEPLVLENAISYVNSLFFNPRRYSLGDVGRFKLNQELGHDFPNTDEYRLLQLEDLITIVKRIIGLKAQPRSVRRYAQYLRRQSLRFHGCYIPGGVTYG